MADNSEPKQSGSKVMQDEERTGPVDCVLFPKEKKTQAVIEGLKAQRIDGQFCDIQIKLSDTKSVYAHKAVLALNSTYFEGMFQSAFKEALSDSLDFSHMADNETVLEDLINTFYGDQIEINKHNAAEILNFAAMLFLPELKDACADVLVENVTLKNVVELLMYATNYDIDSLKKTLKKFLDARFHDYVLFHEDLMELSPAGLQLLLSLINSKKIARKVDYIKYIFRWFHENENNEGAATLVMAIENIRFKKTKRFYAMIENDLEDILNHLDDANSTLSDTVKIKIRKTLPLLKPPDYIRNSSPAAPSENFSDSELEDEPERPRETFGHIFEEFGPPTAKTGFTEDEEIIWDKAHRDMAERDQHRIWAKQYPIKSLSKPPEPDPNRPKKIKREPELKAFRSRKFRVKSLDEMAEEARLVNSVFILAPANHDGRVVNEIFDVAVYIPRKAGWYKLATLNANSISNAFPGQVREPDPKDEKSGRRDSDFDDDRMMHMMFMSEFYPEMMMDAPPSGRRRMMEEMMRRGHMGSMFRRMGGFDDDDDDFMMGPMSMRFRHRMRHQTPKRPARRTTVPSLNDKKWSFVYFRHRLYFVHKELAEMIFCYDIASGSWTKSQLEMKLEEPKEKMIDFLDGIELLVAGRIVYAFVRYVTLDLSRDNGFMRMPTNSGDKEDIELCIGLEYVVFKLTDEYPNMTWEEVFRTERYSTHLPTQIPEIAELHKSKTADRDERRRAMIVKDIMRATPPYIPQDAFKTFFYVVDEEQIYVYTAELDYHKEKRCHNFKRVDCVYLDLKQMKNCFSNMYHSYFDHNIYPIMSDELIYFLTDDLKDFALQDLAIPVDNTRECRVRGECTPEENREFLDALNNFPRCKSITACDGRSIWVLRANDHHASETVEVYVNALNVKRRRVIVTNPNHVPPPYRFFSMASAGKMDRKHMRFLGPALQYQHGA